MKKKYHVSEAQWQDTQSCIWYNLGRGKEVGKKPPGRWRIVMKKLEELGLALPQIDCVSAEGARDAREVSESKRSPWLAETGIVGFEKVHY